MVARSILDFYPTPVTLLTAYLKSDFSPGLSNAVVLEPCVGQGALVGPLLNVGCQVVGTDIDQGPEFNATTKEYWQRAQPCDWVVTNPPFREAESIVRNAIAHANCGVLMLLRQTWLEPCKARRDLLDSLKSVTIVNPRPSFRSDVRSQDSATCGWFVWERDKSETPATLHFLTDWHK